MFIRAIASSSSFWNDLQKLAADPHFVQFTLTLNWNSFHVVGDIAIATSVFER
jgi:hypothetical protein